MIQCLDCDGLLEDLSWDCPLCGRRLYAVECESAEDRLPPESGPEIILLPFFYTEEDEPQVEESSQRNLPFDIG